MEVYARHNRQAIKAVLFHNHDILTLQDTLVYPTVWICKMYVAFWLLFTLVWAKTFQIKSDILSFSIKTIVVFTITRQI